MKALMKKRAGPGGIAFEEIGKPEIGDEDLLIEVKAAGICGSDLRLKNIGDSKALIPPVVMGHEFAGVICEAGKKVSRFQVGERVVSDNSGYLCGTCRYCGMGNYMMCNHRKGLRFGMDGGFAKYVKINGDLLAINPNTLFRIPGQMTYEEAVFMDPLANAYKAVIQESSLKAGDSVVVYGMGTIGLLAVRIASLAGARHVIAVNRSRNERKYEIAQSYGATEIIYGEKDVPGKIYGITKGEGAEVVIDCAGANHILGESLQILRKGGEFVKIGYDSEPLNLSLDDFVRKGIKIIGHFAYDYESWIECMHLLESGMVDVKPLISGRFLLERWEEGFELAEGREGIKVILIP